MIMERQQAFGWLVALDLFLGGAGGGLFLVSILLDWMGKYESATRIGAFLGPVLVLLGAVFLIGDLGAKSRLYRLTFNPSSWMSRGTWILILFIVFSMGYALPGFGLFNWLPWSKADSTGKVIGVVAAVSSLGVVFYTGFLLGTIKSIPFWNTSILPVLFLFSSLYTGIAFLLFTSSMFMAGSGREAVSLLHMLSIAEIILVLFQLFLLWAYLEIARHGNMSSIKSVEELKRSSFIVGVVILGLIIPLGVLLWGLAITEIQLLSMLSWIEAILMLAGGLMLRREILRVGIHLPRFAV